MRPKHQTLVLSSCLGRMEMLRFIWNCLRPFGFIVVEGDPRPMTQKSRPGQGSRNSERKAKGIMSRENATEKTSDFRRRTSAGLRGRYMRRPRVARVVASRGPKSRIGEAALLPLLHWRVIVKRQECRFPEKSARTKTRGECPCWALDVRLAGWPAGRLIARAAGTLL